MSKLTVTMGIPASGKSTAALPYGAFMVNPDAIREEIAGDASNQDRNDEVFVEAHRRVMQGLQGGFDMVFDATNVRASSRARLLEIARDAEAETELIVFDVPLDEAKRRNAQRERVVPEHVLDRMYRQF